MQAEGRLAGSLCRQRLTNFLKSEDKWLGKLIDSATILFTVSSRLLSSKGVLPTANS